VRALTKTTAGPGLELVDRPEPAVGSADVKIRVLRAGLCGTDLHLEQWDDWAATTVTAPLVLGHEFYGEVVEIGDDVRTCAVGDRASGEGHVVCGTCRNCRAGRRHVCINTQGIGVNRDGAFADYVVIPATNVWVQPADLDPDLGAIIGLEMSGVPSAVEEMLENLNHGARVAMLGLPKAAYPINWGRVITHMITLRGIYGREMYDTWYAMSSMLSTSQDFRSTIASVVTHRLPAEEWRQAFDIARSGQCGKVVLDWS